MLHLPDLLPVLLVFQVLPYSPIWDATSICKWRDRVMRGQLEWCHQPSPSWPGEAPVTLQNICFTGTVTICKITKGYTKTVRISKYRNRCSFYKTQYRFHSQCTWGYFASTKQERIFRKSMLTSKKEQIFFFFLPKKLNQWTASPPEHLHLSECKGHGEQRATEHFLRVGDWTWAELDGQKRGALPGNSDWGAPQGRVAVHSGAPDI